MRLASWLSTGSIAALAMAAVAAAAQDTPPPADPQKKDADAEEVDIPVKWNELSFGYSTLRTNSGLSRYTRPPEGITLHELSLFGPGTEKSPYYRVTVRGVPDQDSYIAGYVALNRGHTVLRGSRSHYSFYDFDWRPKDPSEDNESELILDQALTRNIGGFLMYKQKERDGRFPAPREADHTRTRLIAGGVQGKALGGNLGLTVSDRRTFDDTGAQPTTLQRSISAMYSHDFGDVLSLEGAAGYSHIEQAGLPNSAVRSYALSGVWDMGPNTDVQFHLGRQDVDLKSVLNARVQKRLLSSARLVHHFSGWNFQFGLAHKESERVRADQSYVDVPKSNVYDARLSGRLGVAHVTLRGTWEDLQSAAVMNTLDNRQLQWDDRALFQAKIDGGGDLFSAYGTYTYRFQQNVARDVKIRWHNVVFGGSYVFNPALNGFAEFSADNYQVDGFDVTGIALGDYFPNSRSLAFGLNWSKDQNLSASASFNFYESADVRGSQLTLSLRRRFGPNHDLELVVAPWRHEDRLLDMTGYRTTFLMARYTVRF